MGLEIHNIDKEAVVCGYHTYCRVWTPMLGEVLLQVTCGSSNSQNLICQRLNCLNSQVGIKYLFLNHKLIEPISYIKIGVLCLVNFKTVHIY